jgi:hypothetical protein
VRRQSVACRRRGGRSRLAEKGLEIKKVAVQEAVVRIVIKIERA